MLSFRVRRAEAAEVHAGVALHRRAQALRVRRIGRWGRGIRGSRAPASRRRSRCRPGRPASAAPMPASPRSRAPPARAPRRRGPARSAKRGRGSGCPASRKLAALATLITANITAVIERSHHDMGGLPAGKVEPDRARLRGVGAARGRADDAPVGRQGRQEADDGGRVAQEHRGAAARRLRRA